MTPAERRLAWKRLLEKAKAHPGCRATQEGRKEEVILTSHYTVTCGLLVMDLVILNLSQAMRTTPELVAPTLNYHTDQGWALICNREKVKRNVCVKQYKNVSC
ncbi:hypothetical protein TNCV_860261 [Trichonephila clavipes]|nr:hypothetical protein TNCV_860261 [Trichonephila clavipes]